MRGDEAAVGCFVALAVNINRSVVNNVVLKKKKKKKFACNSTVVLFSGEIQ